MLRILPRFFLISLSLILSILNSDLVIAQRNVTTTAIARKKTPISVTLTKNLDLVFGTIAPRPTSGTVTINHSNNAVTFSGVSLLTVSATRTRAQFTIQSSAATIFSVSVPTSIQLSSGGLTPMNVSLTKNLSITGNTIPAGGSAILYIGGTLQVNANQPAGNYTANLPVTINY